MDEQIDGIALFTVVQQDLNRLDIPYEIFTMPRPGFQTQQGDVLPFPISHQMTLGELQVLARQHARCILALVAEDTSVVYYSINPISLQLTV